MPSIQTNEDGTYTYELSMEGGDFAGGRNELDQIGPNESAKGLNMWVDDSGNLRPRPNFEIKGQLPASVEILKRSFSYVQSDGIEWWVQSVIEDIGAGVLKYKVYVSSNLFTWTPLPRVGGGGDLELNLSYELRFASLNYKLYIVDGQNQPLVYDGINTTQTAGFPELPSENITTWNSSIWYLASKLHGERIHFTDANGLEDALNWLDVRSAHSGKVIGAMPTHHGLVIFKEDSEFLLTGYSAETFQLTQIGSDGCKNADSIVNVNGTIVYLSQEGFRMTDGIRTAPLINKLPKTIDNISQSAIYKYYERILTKSQMWSVTLGPPVISGYIDPPNTAFDNDKMWDDYHEYNLYPDTTGSPQSLYNDDGYTVPGNGWTLGLHLTRRSSIQYGVSPAPMNMTYTVDLNDKGIEKRADGINIPLNDGQWSGIPSRARVRVVDVSNNRTLYTSAYYDVSDGVDVHAIREHDFWWHHTGYIYVSDIRAKLLNVSMYVNHSDSNNNLKKVKSYIEVDSWDHIGGLNASFNGVWNNDKSFGHRAFCTFESDPFILPNKTGTAIGAILSNSIVSSSFHNFYVNGIIFPFWQYNYLLTCNNTNGRARFNPVSHYSTPAPIYLNPKQWGEFKIFNDVDKIDLAAPGSSEWGGDWCVKASMMFSIDGLAWSGWFVVYQGSKSFPNVLSKNIQTFDPNWAAGTTTTKYIRIIIETYADQGDAGHTYDTINPRYRSPRIYGYSFAWFTADDSVTLSDNNFSAIRWENRYLCTFTKNGETANNYSICIDRILSEDPRYQLWRTPETSFLNRYGNDIWIANNDGSARQLNTDINSQFEIIDEPFYWETDWFELPHGVLKNIEEIEVVQSNRYSDGLDFNLTYLMLEVWIDGKYAGTLYNYYNPFYRKSNIVSILDTPGGWATNEDSITMYSATGPWTQNVIGWGQRIKFKMLFIRNPGGAAVTELIKAIKLRIRPLTHVYAQPTWNLREGSL